jgi:hypothetical protein
MEYARHHVKAVDFVDHGGAERYYIDSLIRGTSVAQRRILTAPLRRWILIALPLLLLGLDFLFFPIYEGRSLRSVTLMQLLVRRHVTLGSVKGHQIDAAIDAVSRPSYLAHVRSSKPNALVVSSFIDDRRVVIGTFASAVLKKLAKVSPADSKRLRELIAAPGAAAGAVRDLPLKLTPEQRARFPVDHLFIVFMLSGAGALNEQAEVIDRAQERILRRSVALRIDTLVLPALGYSSRRRDSTTFDHFYDTLFESLVSNVPPRRILIDLYSHWPTAVLEEAVTQLNTAMDQATFEHRWRLNRPTVRSLELFVAACLFLYSRRKPLTFRSAATVAAGAIGIFLTAAPVMEIATVGMAPRTTLILYIAVYVILAFAFPILASSTGEEAVKETES